MLRLYLYSCKGLQKGFQQADFTPNDLISLSSLQQLSVFHLQSFETKSLKLADTKYDHGALLGNMHMLYKGPKRG